jgi:hypothetical protein
MFKLIFVHIQYSPIRRGILGSSVGDPVHFGADPDPDPIRLLSSVTLWMLNLLIFFSYNLPAGTLSSVFNLLLYINLC